MLMLFHAPMANLSLWRAALLGDFTDLCGDGLRGLLMGYRAGGRKCLISPRSANLYCLSHLMAWRTIQTFAAMALKTRARPATPLCD